MKARFTYGLLALALVGLASCTFEDKEITTGVAVVYFVNQQYNRNLVVGEGIKLQAGVVMGGMAQNKVDRSVSFEVDPSLLAEGDILLPHEYYTFPQGQRMDIAAGTLEGYCLIQLDSAAFLADPEALTGHFALPLRLTGKTHVDTLLEGKDFICLNLSYFAKQHGNYYYQGTTLRTGPKEGELHYQNEAGTSGSIRSLTTTGPTQLRLEADGSAISPDPAKGTYSFLLDVPTLGGGEVRLSPDPASAVAVTANGTCTYNEQTKTFVLNYRYTLADGTECTACDTLTFRNRIRDVQTNGLYLNEWRGF